MVEEILDAGFALQIEIGMRMSVAREEFPDAQRIGRVAGADDDDVAESLRDDFRVPQHERAHQDFAEVRIGLQQLEKPGAIDLDDASRLRDEDAGNAGTARQHVHFARELARAERRKAALGFHLRADGVELSGDDDVEVIDPVAHPDQHVTARDITLASHRLQPVQLRGGEHRKHRARRRFGRRGVQTSFASSVIFALSSFEMGQPLLASSAAF